MFEPQGRGSGPGVCEAQLRGGGPGVNVTVLYIVSTYVVALNLMWLPGLPLTLSLMHQHIYHA